LGASSHICLIPYSTVINGAPKRAGFKNSINSTIFSSKKVFSYSVLETTKPLCSGQLNLVIQRIDSVSPSVCDFFVMFL